MPAKDLHDLLGKLSSENQEKGDQFERICRWFLLNDPYYKSRVKRVWLWDDWPKAWGPDCGIDLVVETFQRELWAVQAKAYARQYSIKKADVDSFLTESNCEPFTHRLLIATTDRIGKKAIKAIDRQDKSVGIIRLTDLEKAHLRWPATASKLTAKPLRAKSAKKHQERAIKAVVRGFEQATRGQLIMACGTGKTLTALWIAESLGAKRVLVLVPSLLLVSQTLREWTANAKGTPLCLPVCSSEKVRKGDKGDSLLSDASELGLPVTTDPGEIARFLRSRAKQQLVVISTYQSSERVAEAFRSARVPAFDLVLADEAHRLAGAAESDFATILDAQKIKAKRRLFMTATPRYFTGRVKRVAKEQEFEIASMDDVDRFGSEFHGLRFSEAIEADLLSDYQVVITVIDHHEYRRLTRDRALVALEGDQTDARTLAARIAVAKAMKKYGLKRVISFHGRVSRARRFAGFFCATAAWLPARERPRAVWSEHIHGGMPTDKRNVLLRELRDLTDFEHGILCNARCLTEGVDVPTLDGVAFVDPRRSQIDIVQAVGRAIRVAEGKVLGTIVIPVVIESGEDAEATFESSEFQKVWSVISALRDHDQELAEALDNYRRQIGRGQRGQLPPKIKIDLPRRVGAEFARAIELRIVERTTANWEFWYGLVQAFADREGHSRVPAKHQEKGHQVGAWVSAQRSIYQKGELAESRRLKLEQLPGWAWVVSEAVWEEALAALDSYVQREGHSRVPLKHRENGYRLGQWVVWVRSSYRNGGISLEQQKLLERYPDWSWDTREDRWERSLRLLTRFVERTGSSLVPNDHKEDGYRLGKWVTEQRMRHRTGRLPEARIEVLESLPNWSWNAREARWETCFLALVQFAKREGHARVPKGHVESGVRLRDWVNNQRSQRKKLRADRRERLESVKGWVWSTRDLVWHDNLAALEQFVDREGHAEVPAKHREGDVSLGRWVSLQRSSRSTMPAERRERLEGIKGWKWRVG